MVIIAFWVFIQMYQAEKRACKYDYLVNPRILLRNHQNMLTIMIGCTPDKVLIEKISKIYKISNRVKDLDKPLYLMVR